MRTFVWACACARGRMCVKGCAVCVRVRVRVCVPVPKGVCVRMCVRMRVRARMGSCGQFLHARTCACVCLLARACVRVRLCSFAQNGSEGFLSWTSTRVRICACPPKRTCATPAARCPFARGSARDLPADVQCMLEAVARPAMPLAQKGVPPSLFPYPCIICGVIDPSLQVSGHFHKQMIQCFSVLLASSSPCLPGSLFHFCLDSSGLCIPPVSLALSLDVCP